MAYFLGNVVPVAYARLVKFFKAKPEYMKFTATDPIYSVLEKSADLMDDKLVNASNSIVPPVKVTGITIDDADVTVSVGFTLTLPVSIVPTNAANKTIVWSSEDKAIATVVGGVVTGVVEGVVDIIATAADGSGKSDSIVITVEA